MKTDRFAYLYLLFGLLCGFLLGSMLDPETGGWVRRALAVSGILFVAFFWRRIEARAHRHHLEEWDDLRVRGKWFFVVSRYVLRRGFVLLVIFAGPAAFETKLSVTLAFNLLFAALVVPLLIYLGNQEWNDCERETEIQSLRSAAEFISSKQN